MMPILYCRRWLLALCVLLLDLLSGYAVTPGKQGLAIQSSTTIDQSTAFPAALKLGPDGMPHIVYIGTSAHELRFQETGRASEAIPSFSSLAQTEFSFSLAIDSAGQPAVAYVDMSTHDLIYTERQGGVWRSTAVDREGAVGYFVSLAIDRADRSHLSYFDHTNNDIKYAVRAEQGWQVETIDASGLPGFHIPAGFTQLSLACDPTPDRCLTERPQIAYLAYRYKPYDGELRYATRTEQGWALSTVDSSLGAGSFPSLVRDRQGYPWISYYRPSTWDFAYGELRLARYNGQSWQVQVVDQGDYVGRYNALALTSAGDPVIAYFASGSASLRLAWRQDRWHTAALYRDIQSTAWVTLAIDRDDRAHLTYADSLAGVTRHITMNIVN